MQNGLDMSAAGAPPATLVSVPGQVAASRRSLGPVSRPPGEEAD